MKKTYYVIVNKKDIKCEKGIKMSKYVLSLMLKKLKLKEGKVIFNEYGKPYYENSDVYFNISDSNNYIACCVSNTEVGIDIEEDRIVNDIIAKEYLNNISGNYDRLKAWVIKEAYSKLIGYGLKMNFNDIIINSIIDKACIIENGYICVIFNKEKSKFINMNIL